MAPVPNSDSILRAARDLFDSGPLLLRKMQHYRPRICPFDDLLPIVPAGARVLDVGCGSGIFLGLLHYFGFGIDGFGFDASRVAIECATRMAEVHGGGRLRFAYVRKQDSWPEERQYDVVSMLDVLHHIPAEHQHRAFQAAAARVAPGGVLLYKDMSSRPRTLAAANRLHDLVVAREWIHYVPIANVERWAGESGFALEKAVSRRMLWYQHDVRVFRRRLMP